MEALFQKLEVEIHSLFHNESSGHDFDHLKRVFNLSLHIQGKEGGDRLVLGLAALCHDVHRLIQNEKGSYCTPQESLRSVEKILETIGVEKNIQQKVMHCVEFHEEYSFTKEGQTVSDIETLILQDADNLDAIGAVGVARVFAYGGAHGLVMWNPDIPVEDSFENAKHDPTVLHHFYTKLLKLGDHMNTETGKILSKERHDFMQHFVDHFLAEWSGKK
jgi:uncharacterized protein